MLCRKCGAEIPDDAQKCEFCGNAVVDVEKIYNNNDKNRQKQIDKNIEEKKIQLSEIQQRRDHKKARQKRAKIAAVTAICIIAAAAVCGGGYYVYSNMKNTRTVVVTTSPSPAATPLMTHNASATPQPSVSVPPETAQPNSWTSTGETGTGSAPNAATSGGSSSSSSGSAASTGSSSSTGSSGSVSSTGGSSSGSSSASSSSGSSSSTGGSSSNGGHTYNTSAKSSGISTSKIQGQIAVGGEVITINNNWYMTFTSGNTKYYARVNTGATTAQVANKVYTLDAVPTSETYNGNTVYEITSMTKYDGTDYILPNSGVQLLTSADIAGLSKNDLALARNEIYARHGRVFQTEVYRKYFTSKSWYYENPNYNYDDDNANLNEIERQNVDFLLKAE